MMVGGSTGGAKRRPGRHLGDGEDDLLEDLGAPEGPLPQCAHGGHPWEGEGGGKMDVADGYGTHHSKSNI